MNISEKIYTGLCVLFSSLIVLGNLTYKKFVTLQVPFIHSFELSVGAILYPLTFLLTDLIAEFYGKEKANFCVRFAILMNIVTALLLTMMDYLTATSWSQIDDAIFHQVFGSFNIAFIGSIIACYIAQGIDILLYLWIRKLTAGKYLWLRNNGSTAISLFIDTFTVLTFLTIFGVLPAERFHLLLVNSYSWKLSFTICSTPLFYAAVYLINRLLADKSALN